MEQDTIVAVVTPPGEGGVGIVRTSGPLSTTLPTRLFPHLAAPWKTHRMRHGALIDPTTRRHIDHALGCLMRAPQSYTGEDVFEIHCHGNPLILDLVTHLCLRGGCRAARPGEFTLRAFLGGRLDLAQAEAVLDVVRARSNAGLDLAVQQMAGWLSGRIEPLRLDLLGTLAHIEAMVDFVEDDVPPELDHGSIERLRSTLGELEALLEGIDGGAVLREGATLAIVGSPNVGKSSLMNALLGMERSIVTEVAGTTRDTVEETVVIADVPFRTIDTAGLRDSDDLVERIGVERSYQALQLADVVLLVLDRSRPTLTDQDRLAIAATREAESRVVVALNKSDLPDAFDAAGALSELQTVAQVETSAVRSDGVTALRAALGAAALGSNRSDLVGGNVRHRDALCRGAAALRVALDGLENGIPLDLVSFDVRSATSALGEITGHNVDDELLDRIFRDFCIGK